MNTKHKGDIAEQAAALQALRRSWSVSRPVGDNQPYDLIFDISGALVKVQVKSAWLDAPSGNYVVDNRRAKTNRRVMLRGALMMLFFRSGLRDWELASPPRAIPAPDLEVAALE
jgi:hypothetical protein